MAEKLNLPDIGTLANNASARAAINDNFELLEEAIDNTLSRDGTLPNQMEADIDLNNNDLLNVKRIDADEFYKNGVPLEQSVAYADKRYELFSGTGVQTQFNLARDPGSLGNLAVSKSGAVLRPGIDFTYNGTVLTFTIAPESATNNILVRYDEALPTGVTNSGAVGYEDLLATNYNKTVSDMLNCAPVSILRFINPLEHAGIRAGTSTYDCASDINFAFTQCKNLIFPAGRYMIGSTLLMPDRLCLNGEGWSVPYNAGVIGAPQGTVIKLIAGSDCDMVRQSAKATRYSLHIKNIAFDGDGANQSSNVGPDGTYGMYQFNRNGMFFEALYNTVLENLFWYNMRGAGIALHGDGGVGMTNIFMERCHAYNCRTYSIYMEGSATDVRINNGDFGFGRVANLRLTSSNTVTDSVFWTSQCQDITDPATHSTGTGAVLNGGILIAGSNNKITGCRSEGNAGHGIKIVGNDNKISDSIMYFNSATAGTSGLFDGINDAGDDNIHEDLEIRQSASSPHALRKAIKLEAAHSGTRIRGCALTRVGANAASVNYPVQGFTFLNGDKSDFTWAATDIKASQGVAHSVGTSFTKIQFRTEAVDARGEWSTTTDDFTVGEAGWYRIDTAVNLANDLDGNSFGVAIFKNGVEYRRFGQQRAGAALSVAIGGSLEMKLEAGDVIDVRGIAGTAKNTNVGAGLTWIEIRQID